MGRKNLTGIPRPHVISMRASDAELADIDGFCLGRGINRQALMQEALKRILRSKRRDKA